LHEKTINQIEKISKSKETRSNFKYFDMVKTKKLGQILIFGIFKSVYEKQFIKNIGENNKSRSNMEFAYENEN
jgi:hypothetical protein